MISVFRTDNHEVCEVDEIAKDCWIELTTPTTAEINDLASILGVDTRDIAAAVDLEEKARVEFQEKYTLILTDIPVKHLQRRGESYTTIPLGIILTENNILTVCSEENSILSHFHSSTAKDFSTKKKCKFLYQLMLRISQTYQVALTAIDRKRMEFEERMAKTTDENDLFDMHELESTLVYFTTSLRGNNNVLNRIIRSEILPQFPEDSELLNDVIVENQQAIEMAQIYKDIIDSTRELISSIINSRLNNVMKRLTSITMILSIPTVISGMYGMNVDQKWMPLAYATHGFGIIALITLIICVILMIILHGKRML